MNERIGNQEKPTALPLLRRDPGLPDRLGKVVASLIRRRGLRFGCRMDDGTTMPVDADTVAKGDGLLPAVLLAASRLAGEVFGGGAILPMAWKMPSGDTVRREGDYPCGVEPVAPPASASPVLWGLFVGQAFDLLADESRAQHSDVLLLDGWFAKWNLAMDQGQVAPLVTVRPAEGARARPATGIQPA